MKVQLIHKNVLITMTEKQFETLLTAVFDAVNHVASDGPRAEALVGLEKMLEAATYVAKKLERERNEENV